MKPLNLEPFKKNQNQEQEVLTFLESLCGELGFLHEFPPSRFEIWLSQQTARKEGFLESNCFLYREKQKVQGVVISENGEDDIHFICSSSRMDLADGLFQWAKEKLSQGKEGFYTQSFAPRKDWIAKLESWGFEDCDDISYGHVLNLETQDWSKPQLPEGYRFHTPLEYPDDDHRVELMQASFDWLDFDKAMYRQWKESRGYIEALDLAVTDDQGRQAATVMGLKVLGDSWMELETVGVHPDFRGKGLARAVMTECLRRAKGLGYKRAFTGSFEDLTHHLYSSLGETHTMEQRGYWLQLS